MNRHLFGGVVAVGLASIILCAFILSLGVPSSCAQVASDNTFDFTGDTSNNPTTSYLLTDRRETPAPAAGSIMLITSPVYWSTNQYPDQGTSTSTADTSSDSVWSITLDVGNVVGSPSGCQVQILIVDSSFVVKNSMTAVSFTPVKNTRQTIEFDESTWTYQSDNWDIGSYFIVVKFTATTISTKNKWALNYGTGDPIASTLNTGYVIPENLLGFLFVAPLIPLVAKAVARWSERGKPSASRDGEKRGRQ